MWLRFKAWITGGKVVWLVDFDGEQTRTIGYPSINGDMVAIRMKFCSPVTLHQDGKVSGKSYVRHWGFEAPQKKAADAR